MISSLPYLSICCKCQPLACNHYQQTTKTITFLAAVHRDPIQTEAAIGRMMCYEEIKIGQRKQQMYQDKSSIVETEFNESTVFVLVCAPRNSNSSFWHNVDVFLRTKPSIARVHIQQQLSILGVFSLPILIKKERLRVCTMRRERPNNIIIVPLTLAATFISSLYSPWNV